MKKMMKDAMDGRSEMTTVERLGTEFPEVVIRRGHSWSFHLSPEDAVELANSILAAAALTEGRKTDCRYCAGKTIACSASGRSCERSPSA